MLLGRSTLSSRGKKQEEEKRGKERQRHASVEARGGKKIWWHLVQTQTDLNVSQFDNEMDKLKREKIDINVQKKIFQFWVTVDPVGVREKVLYL